MRWLRGWPRIVDWSCPISGGEAYPFDVDFFGLKYRGHLGGHIDRQVFFFDAYEKEELDFVRTWWGRRGGGIALDIGANIGHHTLALSQVFQHVHAFEPNSSPLVQLHEKLGANQVTNVVVHPFGLWDSEKHLTFNLPPIWNTGMGSFKEKIDGMKEAATVLLPVRRGDDVMRKFDIDRVDFLKIDVQGAEHEVIAGLKQTLARSHPLVWIEISKTTRQDFPTLKSVINSLGEGRCYETLTFSRTSPWLNVRTPKPIHEANFDSLDGNLFLCPR